MKFSFLSVVRFLAVACGLVLGAAVAQAQSTLPNGTAGTAYTFTITTSPPQAAGTIYAATNLPDGLSINSTSGTISGTPTTAGTASGTLSLTSNGITNNYAYQLTILPAAGASVITSATTASGTVGVAFSGYTVAASNSPTSFNISGLPPGLSGDPTSGIISGTPAAAGSYAASVSANNTVGTGAATTVTFTIAAATGTPVVTSASSVAGLTTTTYTSGSPLYQILASNSPTSFSASGLPLGLSLDPSTGLITGTPAANGVANVSIAASNGSGSGPTAALAITIGALPVITSAASFSATVGSPFGAQLTGTNTPTSFNLSGLPSGLSANAAGLISGTPTAAGTYTLTASGNNSIGTGPTTSVTLTVAAASSGGGGVVGGGTLFAPTITQQPQNVTVASGGTATFTVGATTASGTLTYQWLFGSNPISGATAATLTLTNVTSANAGSYSVQVSNGVTLTSNAATLTVMPPLTTPITLTTQPVSQTVTVGSSVTFSVVASGTGTLTYQWQKNGAAISGATQPSYTISSAAQTDGGTYTAVVSNGTSSVTSSGAVLTVNPAGTVQATRLVNVSLSSVAGQQPLLVGLTVGGTGSKGALIRAIGPTLASFGVPNPMPDPTLTLNTNSGTLVATNTGWGGTAALTAAFSQVGAFALPSGSKDSALLVNLPSGTYSAQVTSASKTSGLVLLEAYDADQGAPPAKFFNLSALSQAGSGAKIMTIGFVISGPNSKTLLIRGIGPTLASYGVAGVLPTTKLTLYSGQTVVNSNSGWGGSAALSAAFTSVGAFSLPNSSLDSALLVTLSAGAYTVQLSGANASDAGLALVELYDVQ